MILEKVATHLGVPAEKLLSSLTVLDLLQWCEYIGAMNASKRDSIKPPMSDCEPLMTPPLRGLTGKEIRAIEQVLIFAWDMPEISGPNGIRSVLAKLLSRDMMKKLGRGDELCEPD
jgi:hypothetical protein